MNETSKRLSVAVVMIVVSVIVILGLNSIVSKELAVRLFATPDWADSYGFTIQNMMWGMFFVTLGELGLRMIESQEIDKGLKKKYLPEDNHTVLDSSDMGNLSKNTNVDSVVLGSLASFIKRLVMQFQISNSIEQTQNMLNSQLEMKSAAIDSNYNMIRYLTWLIPTLGFIGTVMGIADALAYAGIPGKATAPEFVSELTARLAVAFDTTFVALVMSAILVFLMHLLQGKEENNLVKIGQYCLDNFINRLYVKN